MQEVGRGVSPLTNSMYLALSGPKSPCEVRVSKETKNEEHRTLKRPLDQSAYKTNIPDLAQTKSQ